MCVHRQGHLTDKRLICREWLKDWMDMNCQKMPDRTEASTGRPTWLWPASYTRRAIHKEYVRSMTERHQDWYQYDAFIKVLSLDPQFSNCKRADANSNFKCHTCLSIGQDLEYYRRHNLHGCNDNTILELEAKNEAHMLTVNSQRAVYKKHQQMARDRPDIYLSLIADGMDQNKLCCPSLTARKHLKEIHGKSLRVITRRHMHALPTITS